MKKITNIISAVSFLTIAQLLFFWLLPTESENFIAVYPFYTVMTVVHAVLVAFVCDRFKYPACFSPVLGGSIVVLIEVIAGLSLGVYCEAARTVIFIQAIISVIYILVMAVFIGIAASEDSDEAPVVAEPVRAYEVENAPVVTVGTSVRRMPRSLSGNRNI